MEGIALLETEEAIARAREGDIEAFGEIVEVYQSPIIRYLYRMTGDNELARDLAQDTFLQAYKGLARTTSGLPSKAWLYRIAINNVLRHRRRKKAVAFSALEDDPVSEIAPGSDDSMVNTVAVQEALLKIPERLRVCMVLHFVDGFKYREIAEMLGISEDAVRMRVARGSEEFRRRYKAGGGDTG
jgi:RNA polymerase sigma-70 factor (ECF subfamily)